MCADKTTDAFYKDQLLPWLNHPDAANWYQLHGPTMANGQILSAKWTMALTPDWQPGEKVSEAGV